jgi:hypothetical protein
MASGTDDVAAPVRPDPATTGRRWSVPGPPRLPLPLTGVVIFAGIRVLSVTIAAFVLQQGKFSDRHWSLVRWMRAADGGHYLAIAAHGYTYPPGQLAHASVFSFFPAYPAAMTALARLPGVTLVGAGLAVTAIAGLAAAWGITTLGMKLTADPRISLLMVAVWAVAPSSTVLEMLYAEALFCALAVWALIALVDRRWLTAAGLTVAAGTVRSTAVALVAAVVVAAAAALVGMVRTRQRIAGWWRPLAAALLAPLGLLGFLGYVAMRTGRLDGWFWIENHTFHMDFDWGTSTLQVLKGIFLDSPSVPGEQRQLDWLQAALLAPRHLAGLAGRPPAGPASHLGAGPAHRRAHRAVNLVWPVPDRYRPVGAVAGSTGSCSTASRERAG